MPEVIKNLKTHPGGNRALKRYDPRILALWRHLVQHCHQDSYEIKANAVQLGEVFHVHPNTIRNWLKFFVARKLVSVINNGGGRGMTLEITWLKQGQLLYLRRQTALKYVAAKAEKRRASQQRQTAYKHPTGGFNKNRAARRARIVLTSRLAHSACSNSAINAFCKWIHNKNTTQDQVSAVLDALETQERLSVPRFIKSVHDVFGWIRGLINKLLSWGKAWWDHLHRTVESRRLSHTLTSVEDAVKRNKPCPICALQHDQWAWEQGRDQDQQLNCAGWARVKLDDLVVARNQVHKEDRPVKEVQSTSEVWALWQAEQALERAYSQKLAEQAREKLRKMNGSFTTCRA